MALGKTQGPRGGDRRKENMTFIEAAAEVLRKAGKPLHYKEITELAIAGNLLSHVGKTPEVTMSHRLTSAIKKDDKDIPIVKLKPGVFALREWEGKKPGKKGAAVPVEAPPEDDEAAPGEEIEWVNALEIEAVVQGSEKRARAGLVAAEEESDDDGDTTTGQRETPVTGEDALRADLAASGAELFDDEEDDDQPILAPLSQPGADAQSPGEGGRRRRRRRRRGRGGGQGDAVSPPEGRFAARAGEARFPAAGPSD